MKIQNLSHDLTRRFQINISPEEIDLESGAIIEKLQSTTAIAGHPRGTAPIELIKKLFSSQIKASATENLVNRALSELVATNGLFADAKPIIEEQYKPSLKKKYTGLLLEDNSLDVVVSWTVEPRPEIKNYLNIVIPASSGDRERDVEQQLKILQARSATNSKVDRPAIESDTLMVDIFVLDSDRKEFTGGIIPGYVFTPKFGDSKYFGKELNNVLIGKSVGDKVEYSHKFPDNHPDAYLKGKDTIVCVELKEVNEAIIPELNDAFAVACGKKDLAELKESIEKHWDNNQNQKNQQYRRKYVIDKILESNDLPVDSAKVEKLALSIASSYGVSKEMLEHEKLAAFKVDCFKQAEDDLKMGKILKYIFDIHPNECRLTEADLLKYAGEESQPGNTAAQTLAALKGRHDFNNWVNSKQIRKVLDWVISTAKTE